jgi:hypothetical protein
MVLDEVGGVPILASWWPLSVTAMVHRRDIDGRGVVFGNQGDLYMNAMTWWDHDTSSVWSQPTGEAILGPLKGERLELVPSTLTELAERGVVHDTLAREPIAMSCGPATRYPGPCSPANWTTGSPGWT